MYLLDVGLCVCSTSILINHKSQSNGCEIVKNLTFDAYCSEVYGSGNCRALNSFEMILHCTLLRV